MVITRNSVRAKARVKFRSRQQSAQYAGISSMVRKGGFEPPRLSAPPPQDGVSASSTTSALTSIACRPFEGRPSLHGTRGSPNLNTAPGIVLPSLYTQSDEAVQV